MIWLLNACYSKFLTEKEEWDSYLAGLSMISPYICQNLIQRNLLDSFRINFWCMRLLICESSANFPRKMISIMNVSFISAILRDWKSLGHILSNMNSFSLRDLCNSSTKTSPFYLLSLSAQMPTNYNLEENFRINSTYNYLPGDVFAPTRNLCRIFLEHLLQCTFLHFGIGSRPRCTCISGRCVVSAFDIYCSSFFTSVIIVDDAH